MSTVNQLTTRSAGQEQLKEEWVTLTANKIKAQDALRAAKREIPQDPDKVNNAKADVAKAEDALKEQRRKEKEFNDNEKARILGAGQTKQDTLDNPSNPDASQSENAAQNAASNPEASTGTKSSSDTKQSGGVGGNKQNADGKTGEKELQLGQGFYDAVAGAIKTGAIKPSDIKPGIKGNALDAASATAKEQAQNYRNRSAQNQMEAQRSQQIADRNAASEAGKVASAQDFAMDKGTINDQSFAAGTGIARLRKTVVPDIQRQVDLQLQQQNVANQRREEANTAQEENTAAEGDSKTFAIKSRDLSNDTAEESNLSMGTPEQEEPKEEKPAEQPAEKKEPVQPEPEPPAEQPKQITGNPQHVFNYITYGNDPTSKNYQQKAMSDDDKKLWEAWGKPEPLTEEDVASVQGGFDGNIGQLQQLVKDKRPEFYQKYAETDLGKSRGIGTDSQKNIGNGLTQEELNKASTTVESDERIKNITACLSDQRLKSIREAYDKDGYCSPEDFMWLAAHTGGKFNYNDRDYDFFNDDDWSDDNDGSVLSGYADYIKNYVYTYKPEATEIDSRIDPNQEHIGPMAQDIEKVNPACIKETPEGVKTVDTARLAMMNAGAIGDLARQMQDLVDKLKAIGVE